MPTYRGVQIVHSERLTNSTNGNPRYRLVFDVEPFTAVTQSDASCSYDVDNYMRREYAGRTFTIETTRAGRVSTITPEG